MPTSIVVFWLLGLLLCALSLLPLWRSERWWVRGLDFPRLQLLLLALGYLVAVGWVLGDDRAALGPLLMGAGCCLLQAWWVLPYTPLMPKEVVAVSDRAPSLSLLTANVLMSNRNSAALIAAVRAWQPDILLTLESNVWWQQQLACLHPDYPYRLACPLDNLYGMHLYSRLPLDAPHVQFRVEPGVPSMRANVSLAGRQVALHFLHPAPPSPTENASSAERDTELIRVAMEVAENSAPTIVAGDLNDVAWSATTRLFRKISGLLDPRVGRGMYNSYHAGMPLARWPLDHIFHSHHFGLVQIVRLPPIGSDHFPIFTRLALAGANSEDQGLQADGQDHRWAQEKAD